MNFFLKQIENPHWNVWREMHAMPPRKDDFFSTLVYGKLLNQWENAIMPRKNSQTDMSWQNTKFAQITLNNDEKDAFDVWRNVKGFDSALEIGVLISEGWKSSVTWDDSNKCFIVAATCKDERNVNANICVSSRSDDFVEALLLNVYKVKVLFKGKAIPTERAANNWG